MADIFALAPAKEQTPRAVLERTLAKVGRIKNVTVVIQWDDDSLDTDWSRQKTSELCMSSVLLSDTALRVLKGEAPSGEPTPGDRGGNVILHPANHDSDPSG